MQTDNERYRKMASLAQIGWWEVDLTAGYYLCSDYLSDLLGLDGDRFDKKKSGRVQTMRKVRQGRQGRIFLSCRTD